MADNETSTIISVKDDTASGIRSAINNYTALDKHLQDIKSRNRSMTDTPEEWKARGEAGRQWAQKLRDGANQASGAIDKHNKVQKEHGSILKEVGGELASMATRYVGVAAAIDQAKEGFLEFVKDQEALRVIGARIGATHEQLEKFKETAEAIGHTFGDSFEKVSSTMEAFRTSANLTEADLGKIERIAPAIMEVATRFGVESTELGESFGSFVRQMNIAPAQWEQALGAMSMTSKGLNLDLGQLNRMAPQLTENMAAIGATGMEGMKQTLALLGLARGSFGSTTKAAMGLSNALDEIQRGGGVMQAINMDSESWSRKTEEIKASGGNLFDWYAERIKEAKDNHFQMGELFSDPKMRRFWEMYLSEGGKFSDMLAKIDQESKNFHAGQLSDLENSAMALKKMIHEWSELWEAIGGFAVSAGVTGFLEKTTAELKDVSAMIDNLNKLLDHFSWEKLMDFLPKWKDIHMPTLASISDGMMHGAKGAGTLDPTSDRFMGPLQPLPSTPDIPDENHEHRAFGGSVKAGRTYQVGEKGTELFTAGQSGSITSNDTIKNVERHTDDTNTILTQIRDLMLKQEDAGGGSGSGGGGSGGGGGGGDPASAGAGAGTGGSAGANPMGIGNPNGKGVGGGSGGGAGGITAPAGSPIARQGLATVTTSNGKKFQVDERFAPNFQGFINDYEKAGGVIGPDSGTLGSRPNNASGHPIGAAIDVNQIGRGIRSKNGKTLPLEVEDQLAEKWGLVSGNKFSRNDNGHFGARSVESARAALEAQGVGTASGKTPFEIARAAAVKAGIPDPDTAAAIAMHESGGMKRGTGSVFDRSGGTNPFGQTVKPGTPGAVVGADGQPHAVYGSLQEGFEAHFKRWGSRYGATPEETTRNLVGGGYNTTDPGWSSKVLEARRRGTSSTSSTSDEQAVLQDRLKQADEDTKTNGPRSSLEEAKQMRAELEQPITIRTQMDRGSDSQFRRASMRRELNREVREAAWNSYSDIGAA